MLRLSTDLGRKAGTSPPDQTKPLEPTLQALATRLGSAADRRRPSPRPTASDLGLVPAGDALASTLMAMPLDVFARDGQLLEVRAPWLDVTLWFVPEERDAEALVRDGVSRGRVWTATELMGVMAISGRTSEALRTIAVAKLTFDGNIDTVRLSRVRSGPATDPDQESAETTRSAAALRPRNMGMVGSRDDDNEIRT